MRRHVISFAIGISVALAAFAVPELALRAFWTPPEDWPMAGGAPLVEHLRVDPLLGLRPRPGWAGQWGWTDANREPDVSFPVSIDSRGFRSTGRSAPEGAVRIALLGDSCTFGWGVRTEDTFAAQLEDDLRSRGMPATVLNAAFPGETAVSAQYLLRERVLPEEPDVVVLTFSANNAFRWSAESDAERYASFELRKLALRSHLVQLALRWIVRHLPVPPPPRSAKALAGVRASERKRVAGPLEYERALVEMIARSRRAGARVVLVILPRASQVSAKFPYEDAARAVRRIPLEPRASGEADWTDQERGLIGFSCLDDGIEDVVAALHDGIGDWHPVYPGTGTAVETGLASGARDFASGELERATHTFERIAKEAPDSPLAHYDLAIARLAGGEREEGLRHLATAEDLACNVFLRYQAIAWRMALEHEVPVVDAVLHFQTRGATAGDLFLDPAHPSPEGHAIIARALANELAGRLPAAHGGGR